MTGHFRTSGAALFSVLVQRSVRPQAWFSGRVSGPRPLLTLQRIQPQGGSLGARDNRRRQDAGEGGWGLRGP